MLVKLIGISLAVVVIATAAFFIANSFKRNQSFVSPTTNIVKTQTKRKIDRIIVTCDIYGQKANMYQAPSDLKGNLENVQNNIHYAADDLGQLPKDFPTAPNSTLCGSDSSLKSTYYITSLSNDTLFAYYRNELSARSCSVSDIKKGINTPDITYIIFNCNGIKGLITPDPYRMAYAVVYPSN